MTTPRRQDELEVPSALLEGTASLKDGSNTTAGLGIAHEQSSASLLMPRSRASSTKDTSLQQGNSIESSRKATPLLPGTLPSFHHIDTAATPLDSAVQTKASAAAEVPQQTGAVQITTSSSTESCPMQIIRQLVWPVSAATASPQTSSLSDDEDDNNDNDSRSSVSTSDDDILSTQDHCARRDSDHDQDHEDAIDQSPILVKPKARREPLILDGSLSLPLDEQRKSQRSQTEPATRSAAHLQANNNDPLASWRPSTSTRGNTLSSLQDGAIAGPSRWNAFSNRRASLPMTATVSHALLDAPERRYTVNNMDSSTDSGYGTAPSRRQSEAVVGFTHQYQPLVAMLAAADDERHKDARYAPGHVVYHEPEEMTAPMTSFSAKQRRSHKRWSSLSDGSEVHNGAGDGGRLDHSNVLLSAAPQNDDGVHARSKGEKEAKPSLRRSSSLFGQHKPGRSTTTAASHGGKEEEHVHQQQQRKRSVWHWPHKYERGRTTSRAGDHHRRRQESSNSQVADVIQSSPVNPHSGDAMPALVQASTFSSGISSQPSRSVCSRRTKNDRDATHAVREPRSVKVRHKDKSQKECDFSRLYLAQEIDLLEASRHHQTTYDGALGSPQQSPGLASSSTTSTDRRSAQRVMRFSLDGKYLAIGGQDGVIRVFAVMDTPEQRDSFFSQSPPSSKQSSPDVAAQRVGGSPQKEQKDAAPRSKTCPRRSSSTIGSVNHDAPPVPVLSQEPVKEFRGHTNEVLDLSWSKGGFLLSASMDKTARVWHLSFDKCLASFVHGDFVTSAVFHPRDDRFFLSGCLDGRVRLWNVSAKKLQNSQAVHGMITACAFTATGDTACVGLFSGNVLFYATDTLRLESSVSFKSSKSAKGGRKITGIEPIAAAPSAAPQQDQTGVSSERVLITSNDSCIRVYEIASKRVVARFKSKAYSNNESQIRASLSDDNAYIVAGSETGSGPSGSDSGHVVIWDCASILAPAGMGRRILDKISQVRTSVSGDDKPAIDTGKEITEPAKSKTHDASSSETAVEYFTAHASTVSCAVVAPLSSSALARKAGDPLIAGTEAKLRQRHRDGWTEVDGSRAKNLAAAVTAPMLGLQRSATNGCKVPTEEDAFLAEACRQTRIIVSVDDNAILRVWRSDPLHVVGP